MNKSCGRTRGDSGRKPSSYALLGSYVPDCLHSKSYGQREEGFSEILTRFIAKSTIWAQLGAYFQSKNIFWRINFMNKSHGRTRADSYRKPKKYALLGLCVPDCVNFKSSGQREEGFSEILTRFIAKSTIWAQLGAYFQSKNIFWRINFMNKSHGRTRADSYRKPKKYALLGLCVPDCVNFKSSGQREEGFSEIFTLFVDKSTIQTSSDWLK